MIGLIVSGLSKAVGGYFENKSKQKQLTFSNRVLAIVINSPPAVNSLSPLITTRGTNFSLG